MKILHIYKVYYPRSKGGIERSIKNIIEGTNKLGLNSQVLTTLKKKNNKIISFKQNFEIFRTLFSLGLLLNYKQITNKFDILHYHYPWPFMDLLHLMWNIKKPTILTYHSDIIRQKKIKLFYSPLKNFFYQKFQK